jgi:hypothetical protein
LLFWSKYNSIFNKLNQSKLFQQVVHLILFVY